jgi:hypothetical protein
VWRTAPYLAQFGRPRYFCVRRPRIDSWRAKAMFRVTSFF